MCGVIIRICGVMHLKDWAINRLIITSNSKEVLMNWTRIHLDRLTFKKPRGAYMEEGSSISFEKSLFTEYKISKKQIILLNFIGNWLIVTQSIYFHTPIFNNTWILIKIFNCFYCHWMRAVLKNLRSFPPNCLLCGNWTQ